MSGWVVIGVVVTVVVCLAIVAILGFDDETRRGEQP